jgi:hypothetical protein
MCRFRTSAIFREYFWHETVGWYGGVSTCQKKIIFTEPQTVLILSEWDCSAVTLWDDPGGRGYFVKKWRGCAFMNIEKVPESIPVLTVTRLSQVIVNAIQKQIPTAIWYYVHFCSIYALYNVQRGYLFLIFVIMTPKQIPVKNIAQINTNWFTQKDTQKQYQKL